MKRILPIGLLAAVLLAVAYRAGYRAGVEGTSVLTSVRVDTVVLEHPVPDTIWRERTVVRWLARAERNPPSQTVPGPVAGVDPATAPTVSAGRPGTNSPVSECPAAPRPANHAAVGIGAAGVGAYAVSGPVSVDAGADFRAAGLSDRTGPGGCAAAAAGGDSGIRAKAQPLWGGDSVPVEVPIDRYLFTDSTYRVEVTGFDVRMERIEVYPRTVVRTPRSREPARWGVSVGVGVGITPSGRVEPALQLHVGWRLFPLGRRRER